MEKQREQLPFDVLFVGGGPANLAGAIHLARLARENGLDIEIGLIEKGDYLGAHSLSGAIVDPVALAELIPDFSAHGCPIENSVCEDVLYYLTHKKARHIPFVPPPLQNKGCFITSLSSFVAWLGQKAEDLGVNVFCGFAGTRVLFGPKKNSVAGVRTNDRGVDKSGREKSNFEPGVDLPAKVTVFGEGSKGSLIREVDRKIGIFPQKMPQIYETAIKEIIELPQTPVFPRNATVVHTFGHPLNFSEKGGGFLYALDENRVALGLVMGLDYKDPLFDPYNAFIAFKSHGFVRRIISGGKVLQQGAKTMCVGGYYSMPTLAVDGALFTGESASMLNPKRLKGVHTSMKSGMLAAEAIIQAFIRDDFSQKTLSVYEDLVKSGWLGKELYEARNFSQALTKKAPASLIYLAAQQLTQGKGIRDPWPLRKDCLTLKKISKKAVEPVALPRAPKDTDLFVDKLTGVYLSGTKHEEDQPCHLIIENPDLCAGQCYRQFRNPCTRFCPGQVYELEMSASGVRRLKINPSNCLHCKTCEIKDPYKNITWTCPEGGGPNYRTM